MPGERKTLAPTYMKKRKESAISEEVRETQQLVEDKMGTGGHRDSGPNIGDTDANLDTETSKEEED